LLGVVRSVDDCSPIPGAQIEFWMAGPNGEYTDEYRATMYSDENGAYRFESHFPPAYSGRPPHIHIKVSKEGFQSLTTQHYPVEATDSAAFDLVLVKLP
jgi:protocatechuate 3,4-dioxygenase beta subunit